MLFVECGIIYLSHQFFVHCCILIRTQGLLQESQQNRDNDAGFNGFSKAYEEHC